MLAVGGVLSEIFILCNIVFQGTVLGPALWNAFFGDVATDIPQGNQEINLFADDLTVMSFRNQRSPDASLLEEMEDVQRRTHEWGRRNQVQFDGSKESIKILHPAHDSGDDFRLLGTMIDCKLTMRPCLEYVLRKFKPKIGVSDQGRLGREAV